MIKIDAAWQATTAEKLQGRLPIMLQPLQSHPQPAVRGALAAGNKISTYDLGPALAPSQRQANANGGLHIKEKDVFMSCLSYSLLKHDRLPDNCNTLEQSTVGVT